MNNIRITQDMTPEEKKLAKREYMREYMRKKYADPEYLEKIRKINRESKARRWIENPEIREKAYADNRKYYQKYKDAYKQARENMMSV